MGKKKLNKEDLEEIVKKCYSIADFCREMGWQPRGDNYKTFHRYVKEYDLDTSHFTSLKSNIGNKNNSNKTLTVSEYLKSKCVRGKTLLKKLINENIKEYKCEICGNTKWQDSPIPLEIHHKDGNHFNNNLDNIQLLCPNCHALTESYCGKKNRVTRHCTECGDEISRWSQSGLCAKCARKKQRVVERPSAEELQQLLFDTSFSAVGKKYGVSYHTVCKWCKYYNIPDSAKFYEKK